jgi:hypothetical protein
MVQQILTQSALLDLLCRNPEDRENLDHYLNDYIHHLCRWWYSCVGLEAPEEHFDALKDVDKSVLTCSSILGCLRMQALQWLPRSY